MTKLVFIGDVHVANHRILGGVTTAGINDRCRLILDSLSRAAAFTNEVGAEALVILGDLFDHPKPSPQIVTAVQECLEEVPAVIISGNHDQCSDHPNDHALGPLSLVAEVITEPDVLNFDGLDLLAIPYQAGPAKTWLRDNAKYLASQCNKKSQKVMAFHAGIKDAKTPAWLSSSDASIEQEALGKICKPLGIETAFAGHWHNAKRVETKDGIKLVQAGAYTPTGWSNPGMEYGFVYLFDTTKTGSNYIFTQLDGPRFLTIDMQADISILKRVGKRDVPPFIRIKADQADSVAAHEVIKAAETAELILGGNVVIDAKENAQAARTAASVTRDAQTLDEAVSAFISKMPLDVTSRKEQKKIRKDIETRVRGFLNTEG